MDELKIRLVKVAVCVIATAGQHRVGKAVCQQSFQPHGEIQVIQIFQEAVLPGVAQFFQIIGQIVLRNHLAHGTDLLHEGDTGSRSTSKLLLMDSSTASSWAGSIRQSCGSWGR